MQGLTCLVFADLFPSADPVGMLKKARPIEAGFRVSECKGRACRLDVGEEKLLVG